MGKEILQASSSDGRKLISFHQHDSVKQIVRAELCGNKFFSVPSTPFLAKGKKNSGASDEDIWAIQNHFGREITDLIKKNKKISQRFIVY